MAYHLLNATGDVIRRFPVSGGVLMAYMMCDVDEMPLEGQAMSSLRDQLLKAGMITKDHKRQVDQDERRKRKQHKKGRVDDERQTQQKQAYAAKLEAQRAADRQRTAAQRAEHNAKEQRLQIRHIIDYWKVSEEPGGARRWYFTSRSNTIQPFYMSDPLAAQLGAGALAIVEYPDETETPYVLVDHEAAALIARIDPQYVRFHNNQPADDNA
ncbi:hypothetical protein NKDENANG_00841 [Candidatus Entotheonellaceae bacterium PAL068K]